LICIVINLGNPLIPGIKVQTKFRYTTLFRKAIQRPPDGTLIFAKFNFGLQYRLVFADAACLHLGINPQVNFAIGKYFGSDETGLIHGRKYAFIKQRVGKLNVHGGKSKVKSQKAKGKRQKAKGKRQKAKGKRQKAKGKRQKAMLGMKFGIVVLSVREGFDF